MTNSSGLVLAGADYAAYHWGLRPWYERWGATGEEVRAVLPGDELVPRPIFVRTRAQTINAPVDKVWPWLQQLGQDKASLYTHHSRNRRRTAEFPGKLRAWPPN